MEKRQSLKGLRILYVEDELSQSLVAMARLRRAGAEDTDLCLVGLLSEAQRALEESSFDVIVLDLNLPDSTGMATFRALRQLAARTPVVILTSLSQSDLAQSALAEGAQEYLFKDELQENTLGRTLLHCVERAKLTSALREAEAEARRESALKSQYLAQVSHEIRTPMNGVVGLASLLLQTDVSPQQREMLEVIHRSGAALVGIISDILDFSKIESGKLTIARERFPVRELIEDVVLLFLGGAEKKGLLIGNFVDPGVSSHLGGDALRIKQIVSNLISNAVKFTASGGVIVRVSLDSTERPQSSLIIEVEDTGSGMSEAETEKIFQPFVQLARHDQGENLGTGLGLAISARLAFLMGGALTVRSELGRGSTFRLSLPVDVEPMEFLPRPALEGFRVAVACQSTLRRELVSRQLTSRQLMVAGFASWPEFLESESKLEAWNLLVVEEEMFVSVASWRRLKEIQIPVIVLGTRDQGLPEGFVSLGNALVQSKVYALAARLLGEDSAPSPTSGGVDKPSGVRGAGAKRKPGARALSVLVVDDVALNRDIATRLLEHLGHRCRTASDGDVAVSLVSEGGIDVVLMDCRMPRCDGWEATRRIRAHENESVRSVPVVALTANAVDESVSECFAAGMNAVLHKPLTIEQLELCLEETLGHGTGLLDFSTLSTLEALTLPTDAESFVAPLVRTYVGEFPIHWEHLVTARRAGEGERVSQIAHKLKGMSRNVGAAAVAELCAAIEGDPMSSAWQEMEMCFHNSRLALQEYLGKK